MPTGRIFTCRCDMSRVLGGRLASAVKGDAVKLHLGFRVEAVLELYRWKVLEIGPDVPLTVAPSCPCDLKPLRTLCTLTDHTGSRRVRVGCCPSCGHITYIDRPTKAWMDGFYLEAWDANHAEGRVAKRTQRLLAKRARKKKTVVTLATELDVDRQRPVCEIGCGWGESLQHLLSAGFSTTIGTEASAHRAATVRAGLGVCVLTGAFESAATQRELVARAPFSIILSNHVLEHTYHADEVIAAASRLQNEGDHLIIAVPNQEGEPPMGVLLFLPHLHSFTRASLERLGARYGYSVVDDHWVHPRQLVLMFRKSASVLPVAPSAGGVFERTVATYRRHLHLHRWQVGRRRLWWERRGGRIGQRWMLGGGTIEARSWQHAVRRRGYRETRSLAIRNLRRRFTQTTESPFEIQFSGPIGLMYK